MGRKATLVATEDSLPDLKWYKVKTEVLVGPKIAGMLDSKSFPDLNLQELKTENIVRTLVQPAEIGTKLSSSRSPLRTVLAVQDSDKSSDPFASGLYIEGRVDGKDYKFLDSKPFYLLW